MRRNMIVVKFEIEKLNEHNMNTRI